MNWRGHACSYAPRRTTGPPAGGIRQNPSAGQARLWLSPRPSSSLTFLVYMGGYGSPVGTGADGVVTLQDRGAHVLAKSLFDAFNSAAWFLFGLGNAVVFAGEAGVLLAEAGPGGVVPRWVALVGGGICGLQAILSSACSPAPWA